jgi:hypothetical protein
MRAYPEQPQQSRSLVDVIGDAVALLHQDIAEYGFAALAGAIGAAFAALVLAVTGGLIGTALIAPVVFVVALITYADTCAAIRRVQDNLEPDAVRAFGDVVLRLPALIQALTLPLALSGASVLAGTVAARWAPDNVVTLGVTFVFAACGLSAFQRSLYVPALFARETTFAEARARSAAAMRSANALVGACVMIALAPAGLMALVALSAGFGALPVAMASFMLVLCMPLAAAVASLIYDAVALQPAQSRPVQRRVAEDDLGERIVRRMR